MIIIDNGKAKADLIFEITGVTQSGITFSNSIICRISILPFLRFAPGIWPPIATKRTYTLTIWIDNLLIC